MAATGRFEQIFGGRSKPVIAMAHVPPLPGTPLYNEKAGVSGMLDAVARDLQVLLERGVDAVMFCNEGDRPYSLRADFEGVSVMTRIVTELAPRDRPFGVDFLWDARAALAIAIATGASFIREVTTGVYDSDMGLWNTDVAGLLRYRRQLAADEIAIFMNVTPEFASPIGCRSIKQVARSAVVSSLADAILVSGPMAGAEPDLESLQEAKDAVGGEVPVLLNTGAKANNVADFLRVADGVIVGSSLKVDGYTWNPVDPQRVAQFMDAVGAQAGVQATGSR
jgi:membrane complex biogenesis BtpA family protein